MSEDISRREQAHALYRVAQFRPGLTAGIIALSVFAAVLEGIRLSFLLPIIQLAQGEVDPAQAEGRTGACSLALGGDQSMSVMGLAETVQERARDVGLEVDVEVVENRRGSETLVEDFSVDASRAREKLRWGPREMVEGTVTSLLE